MNGKYRMLWSVRWKWEIQTWGMVRKGFLEKMISKLRLEGWAGLKKAKGEGKVVLQLKKKACA